MSIHMRTVWLVEVVIVVTMTIFRAKEVRERRESGVGLGGREDGREMKNHATKNRNIFLKKTAQIERLRREQVRPSSRAF